MAARLGSLNAAAGQVVPDTRTNSLVVSTTAENLALVEKLLRELDAPAHPQPTTLVVPLQNARASDLGLLLNQAFSTSNRGRSGLGAPAIQEARPPRGPAPDRSTRTGTRKVQHCVE